MTQIQTTTIFKAELAAALEILAPQIRGLEDLSKISLSGFTMDFINTEIITRTRRRGLIIALVRAIDALLADGFPDMPNVKIPANLFMELMEQLADLKAALDEFEERPQVFASKISAALPLPVDKLL